MNRPFILTRILGAPLVALPVFLFCCALLVSWYQGHTSWQIAFVAAGLAYRTISSAKRMRDYKAWIKDWQAMGPNGQDERPRQSRGAGVVFTTILLLFGIAYPAYMGSLPLRHVPTAVDSTLTLLWGLACIYLVIKLGWSLMRRRSMRRKTANEPVAVMIGKASSCPTRSSATRALPEYCATLLSRSADKKRLDAHASASLAAG